MSVHNYIAKFLKENGYHKTLEAFCDEHDAPLDTDIVHSGEIDPLLIDKLNELSTSKDRTSAFSKSLDSPWMVEQPQLHSWTQLDLSCSSKLPLIDGLVIDCAISPDGLGIFATAARKLIIANVNTGQILMDAKNAIGNFVVRKVEIVGEYLVLGGINGLVQTARFNASSAKLELIESIQAHERLIIDMKVIKSGDATLIVTLGWDKYVQIFKLNDDGKLTVYLERILISGIGTCLEAFSDEEKIYIVVGLQASSLLDVVTICSNGSSIYKVATSDVEYSSITSFPMCISGVVITGLGPVIAVATSQEPYMRIVLISLANLSKEDGASIQRSQILANFNTLSPQDKYSEAKVIFRPNGEGVWIFGDDGIIRALELSSGSITHEFKAHEGRIKAMALLNDSIITCGIDRDIKFWKEDT